MLGRIRRLWGRIVLSFRLWWLRRGLIRRFKKGLRFLDKVWREHAGLG